MSLFMQALDKYRNFKKSYSCLNLVESPALVIPMFGGVLACSLAVVIGHLLCGLKREDFPLLL